MFKWFWTIFSLGAPVYCKNFFNWSLVRQNESDWICWTTNTFYASFHITSTITENRSNGPCDYWPNGGHQRSDRALVTMSNGLCDHNLNLENWPWKWQPRRRTRFYSIPLSKVNTRRDMIYSLVHVTQTFLRKRSVPTQFIVFWSEYALASDLAGK